ncbi:MAG TPA: pentapeptide repeat-containing protein [Pyrinomonadaceae bacterium]|nr:pentapeptide repeat-containing protein [Pyrinomonadaceae bacterium]
MSDDSSTSSPPDETAEREARLALFAERLRAGDPVEFTPEQTSEERSLPASWLSGVLSSRRPPTKPLVIRGAHIEGKLRLRYATFKCELCITGSRFDEGLDLSFATFKGRVDFSGSHFAGEVAFREANAERDLTLARATFSEDAVAVFDDLQVDGVFHAEGAQFGAASFKRCRLERAAFFGPAIESRQLIPTRFSGDADFTDARIEGPAYFDCATFKGQARFRRVRVNSAAYFRAHTDGDMLDPQSPPASPPFVAEPEPARFEKRADFNHAEIHGPLSFEGARFHGQLDFQRARLDGSLIFNTYVDKTTKKVYRTAFLGKVDFIGVQVAGGAAFLGVRFAKAATFERMRVGGHLLFKALAKEHGVINTVFVSTVKFLGAYVRHNAEFDGVRFNERATFDRFEVGHNIFFRPAFDASYSNLRHKLMSGRTPRYKRTVFRGVADFVGMQIHGDAEFTSTRFRKQARFEGIHVEGNAFFNDRYDFPEEKIRVAPVRFLAAADFTSAHFKHQAKFYHARFGQEAVFRSADFDGAASFVNAHFVELADFTGCYFRQRADFNAAEFLRAADFTSVNIDGAAFFKDARLQGKTCFRAARFKALDFNINDSSKPPFDQPNFGNDLNLEGFTYDLIDINPDIRDALFKSLDQSNRQPYTQLERVLRLTGQDQLADYTYLKQRERDRRQQERELKEEKEWRPWLAKRIGLLFDTAQMVIGNYGVQPFPRLFAISCAVLVVGTLVFYSNGSVVPRDADKKFVALKEDADGKRLIVPVEREDKSPPPPKEQLNLPQAFAVSLNEFIPIVQIPSGSKWKPSENLIRVPFTADRSIPYISYAFYGTIHSILGVLLVPLGVAALAGVLHRQEKPGK